MNPHPAPVSDDGARARSGALSRITAALAIAFVAVFFASLFDRERVLFETLAKIDERVRAGEMWRLFTASFLHANLLHLWFNCTALFAVGPGVEIRYGRTGYLAVFLVGGAVGMAASVLLVPQPSVGASAGIFALLGALLAQALRTSPGRLPRGASRALVVRVLGIVALNLAIGFVARFIDNAAHVGGLVGGFVLGLLLPVKEPIAREVRGPEDATAPAGRGGEDTERDERTDRGERTPSPPVRLVPPREKSLAWPAIIAGLVLLVAVVMPSGDERPSRERLRVDDDRGEEVLVAPGPLLLENGTRIAFAAPVKARWGRPALCFGFDADGRRLAQTGAAGLAVTLTTEAGEHRSLRSPFLVRGRGGQLVCFNEAGPSPPDASYTGAIFWLTAPLRPLRARDVWFASWPE